MNVAELVQLVDGAKHLRNVEPSMLLLQDARVVEQGTEVAASDEVLSSGKRGRRSARSTEPTEYEAQTHHGKIDVSRILECVKQANEPRRVGGSENIALGEDVANLVGRRAAIS